MCVIEHSLHASVGWKTQYSIKNNVRSILTRRLDWLSRRRRLNANIGGLAQISPGMEYHFMTAIDAFMRDEAKFDF